MMKNIAAIFLTLLLISCSSKSAVDKSGMKTFESAEFGFSFKYPSSLNAVDKDLPNNWAATDSRTNTLIFLTDNAGNRTLLELGVSQALTDMYENPSSVTIQQLEDAANMVKLEKFNNLDWFTYGIKTGDVNSLVSGTVCSDKLVLMAFVIPQESYFEQGKQAYNRVLESFQCLK